MAEACSKQIFEEMMEKRKQVFVELQNMDDFYMEMRWEFHCWGNNSRYLFSFLPLSTSRLLINLYPFQCLELLTFCPLTYVKYENVDHQLEWILH